MGSSFYYVYFGQLGSSFGMEHVSENDFLLSKKSYQTCLFYSAKRENRCASLSKIQQI
jgi:hypothetical protein